MCADKSVRTQLAHALKDKPESWCWGDGAATRAAIPVMLGSGKQVETQATGISAHRMRAVVIVYKQQEKHHHHQHEEVP